MAKAHDKALKRLESRQRNFDTAKLSANERRARKRPGSMNKHKGSAFPAAKR